MTNPTIPRLSMERIKGFTDGVLAVVITLLVLGLEVPEGHDFERDGIWPFLKQMWVQVHPYVASFALVSAYWVQHLVIFHYIDKGSRLLVWINLVFLLVISPLPFLTNMRSTYPAEPSVGIVFGLVQVLCGLCLFGLWYRVTRVNGVAPSWIEPETVRSMNRRILAGPVVVILASMAGNIDPHLASFGYLCVPLLYVSHKQVDSNWQAHQGEDDADVPRAPSSDSKAVETPV